MTQHFDKLIQPVIDYTKYSQRAPGSAIFDKVDLKKASATGKSEAPARITIKKTAAIGPTTTVETKEPVFFNLFNEKVSHEIPVDEHNLRYLLWMNHGALTGHYLYGDDGELHCNTCHIDFKRDTVDAITNSLSEQNFAKVIKLYNMKDGSEEHY